MNNFQHFPRRTTAEAMVMNPPEPAKEKEKQGFFRAIKKKKKKTQIVRPLKSSPVISSSTHTNVSFGSTCCFPRV